MNDVSNAYSLFELLLNQFLCEFRFRVLNRHGSIRFHDVLDNVERCRMQSAHLGRRRLRPI